MARPISIVIPAFNQLDYCRQCVLSVQLNTRREHRLILVDNGSTDGVGEYFDAIPGAVVIHSETNRGFAGGVNLGLERADGHVVLLNSDTLVPEGWLERLEAALTRAEDIGMVGPMSNCVSGIQQIDNLQFSSLDEISAYANQLAHDNVGKLRDTDRLVGFCLVIREEARQKVGRFDERFGIGNFEDDDYCLRARRAGFRLCVAGDCFVFHYGSRTFAGMGMVGESWKSLMDENEQQFRAKWTGQNAKEARDLDAAARQALERGELPEALRLLAKAIELAPADAVIHNDLGVTLWRLGERERALSSFARAVRLQSDYTEAQENLREAREAL
ncbi:MAG: glycosyltransferase [Candidatus Hydrogenedentes bacterium]|nr:glycosyltransferase [Candidatus Hydrogenedentota bacterium]